MQVRPEIILGPPGTGKTTTLLGIVEAELAGGCDPLRLGYVSFTRKAAEEARTRAATKFKLPQKDLHWFRTLHSLSFNTLGMKSGETFADERRVDFGNYIKMPVSAQSFMSEDGTFSRGSTNADRILHMENLARVRMVTLRQQYDHDSDEQSWDIVKYVCDGLAEYKRARGLVDYTDMLQQFVGQQWTPQLDVLIVDEAQDLSRLQWAVVEKLAATVRRLVIAGDDDQAIYNWAGADVDFFMNMPGDRRVLGQSYRVPQKVQALAHDTISRVKNRLPKTWASRPEAGKVGSQNLNTVDWSQGDDVLVLARNVEFLFTVKRELDSAGYMYTLKGRHSIEDKLRNALVDWEALRRGEAVAVSRIVKIYDYMESRKTVEHGHKKLPAWGREDKVTFADLCAKGGLLLKEPVPWFDALDKVPLRHREYIRACARRKERISQRPRIRLNTIHTIKGGEAAHVILIPDISWRTWLEYKDNPDDEARVWYVAITRAKERLTLVTPRTKNHWRF